MALLLNIDTATEIASVCVSDSAFNLSYTENEHQKEHASFIHNAIASVLAKAGLKLKDIDAFAVTSGPGSYTGLRVSMATAKGFSYAFKKPLITINTLKVMAKAAIDIENSKQGILFCPMLDARRLEAFVALYDEQLKTLLHPQATFLSEKLFDKYLQAYTVKFLGSGSIKFQGMLKHQNGTFLNVRATAKHLAILAAQAFTDNQFDNVAQAEPDYCKAVYTLNPKKLKTP